MTIQERFVNALRRGVDATTDQDKFLVMKETFDLLAPVTSFMGLNTEGKPTDIRMSATAYNIAEIRKAIDAEDAAKFTEAATMALRHFRNINWYTRTCSGTVYRTPSGYISSEDGIAIRYSESTDSAYACFNIVECDVMENILNHLGLKWESEIYKSCLDESGYIKA